MTINLIFVKNKVPRDLLTVKEQELPPTARCEHSLPDAWSTLLPEGSPGPSPHWNSG